VSLYVAEREIAEIKRAKATLGHSMYLAPVHFVLDSLDLLVLGLLVPVGSNKMDPSSERNIKGKGHENDLGLITKSIAEVSIGCDERQHTLDHRQKVRPRAKKKAGEGNPTQTAKTDSSTKIKNERSPVKKKNTKTMEKVNDIDSKTQQPLELKDPTTTAASTLSDSRQQLQTDSKKKKSGQKQPQLVKSLNEDEVKPLITANKSKGKVTKKKVTEQPKENGADKSEETSPIPPQNPNHSEKGQSNTKSHSVNKKPSGKNKNENKSKLGGNVEQHSNDDTTLPVPSDKEEQKQLEESLSSQKSTVRPKSNKIGKEEEASSLPPNQPQLTNDINYGKGKPIVVLHIGEKPSIAQAVAKGLCASSSTSSSKGKSLPVYEFTVTDVPFPKAPNASKVTHRVTSVAGHVFSIDFAPQYQSWEIDPVLLFNAPIVRKPCQVSVVKHLQNEASGVDFLVLWMDCDREGENINFETLDCCLTSMKSPSTAYDRVYRAYFSAINPSDIQKAYQKLGKPDKNQSLSVDARQELDLKVGVAFSRFQTKFFQGRYGDLDSAVLSYGPCQTPTLGFCVQRYLAIQTFTPEPYWLLDLNIIKRGRVCKATWDTGRSFNRKKVELLLEKCWENQSSAAAVAKVISVTSKPKKQGRPTPLNTVALLKACSKALGIGPHQAMQAAERLYLLGYLSYPRTESTAYPKSFDIHGTLQTQAGDPRWGPYVRELLQVGPTQSKRGGEKKSIYAIN
jgi:hypothetical protein